MADECSPSGLLLANPWGLQDTHGNLWEWCEDDHAPTEDSSEADSGRRVVRGGSFNWPAPICRSASRTHILANFRKNTHGFASLVKSVLRMPSKAINPFWDLHRNLGAHPGGVDHHIGRIGVTALQCGPAGRRRVLSELRSELRKRTANLQCVPSSSGDVWLPPEPGGPHCPVC